MGICRWDLVVDMSSFWNLEAVEPYVSTGARQIRTRVLQTPEERSQLDQTAIVLCVGLF